MGAQVERLSWRESVAAQLYEIADSWSKGDMSVKELGDALHNLKWRCHVREDGAGHVWEHEREKEWR